MGKKPDNKGVNLDKYSTQLVSNISCGALLGAVPFAVLFFLLSNPIFIILAIAVASAGMIADGVVLVKARIDKKRKEKLAMQKAKESKVSLQKAQEEQKTKEAEQIGFVKNGLMKSNDDRTNVTAKEKTTEDCQEA